MRSLKTIDSDIARVKKTVEESAARLKQLEGERRKVEDFEIIRAIRSSTTTDRDIYALRKRYAKAAEPTKTENTSIKKEQEEPTNEA